MYVKTGLPLTFTKDELNVADSTDSFIPSSSQLEIGWSLANHIGTCVCKRYLLFTFFCFSSLNVVCHRLSFLWLFWFLPIIFAIDSFHTSCSFQILKLVAEIVYTYLSSYCYTSFTLEYPPFLSCMLHRSSSASSFFLLLPLNFPAHATCFTSLQQGWQGWHQDYVQKCAYEVTCHT